MTITAFDSLVYTAGGHPAVYASDSNAVSLYRHFKRVLGAFLSLVYIDIWSASELI